MMIQALSLKLSFKEKPGECNIHRVFCFMRHKLLLKIPRKYYLVSSLGEHMNWGIYLLAASAIVQSIGLIILAGRVKGLIKNFDGWKGQTAEDIMKLKTQMNARVWQLTNSLAGKPIQVHVQPLTIRHRRVKTKNEASAKKVISPTVDAEVIKRVRAQVSALS